MNKVKILDSLKTFLESMKAMDAEIPEELAEDALEMTEEINDALNEENTFETKGKKNTEDADEEEEEVIEKEGSCKDKEPVTSEKIEKVVEDTISKVLLRHGVIKDSCMNSLDELEEEMKKEVKNKDDDNEEEVTVDPEIINEKNDKEEEKEKVTLSDSAKAELIKKVKPIIANISNKRDRKKISDAFAKALRSSTPRTTMQYKDIFDIAKSNAKDSRFVDNENLGEEIAKKYNPHYMNKEVK